MSDNKTKQCEDEVRLALDLLGKGLLTARELAWRCYGIGRKSAITDQPAPRYDDDVFYAAKAALDAMTRGEGDE